MSEDLHKALAMAQESLERAQESLGRAHAAVKGALRLFWVSAFSAAFLALVMLVLGYQAAPKAEGVEVTPDATIERAVHDLVFASEQLGVQVRLDTDLRRDAGATDSDMASIIHAVARGADEDCADAARSIRDLWECQPVSLWRCWDDSDAERQGD